MLQIQGHDHDCDHNFCSFFLVELVMSKLNGANSGSWHDHTAKSQTHHDHDTNSKMQCDHAAKQFDHDANLEIKFSHGAK